VAVKFYTALNRYLPASEQGEKLLVLSLSFSKALSTGAATIHSEVG
jgi:hypothetical protein